jgi:GABA(A) receptor-associated protein|tara:strand:+ start:119 stop:541 length:423 start_codon:yes stop_codon:yes gene_type:complete
MINKLSASSLLDTPMRIRKMFKQNTPLNQFELNHSFEKRKDESFRILQQYPDRVPIICERINHEIPELSRKKYLVPDDLIMCNFMYVIRKRLILAPEVSIYLFVNKKIVPSSMAMGDIYNKYKSEDGFLYIHYSGESTFG